MTEPEPAKPEHPPDIPILFRVDLLDGRCLWGVAKPCHQEHPEWGRGIMILTETWFGWWHADSTLADSVRRLFPDGGVTAVHVAETTFPWTTEE